MRFLLLFMLACPSASALEAFSHDHVRPPKPERIPLRYIVVVNEQTGEQHFYIVSRNPLRLPRRVE